MGYRVVISFGTSGAVLVASCSDTPDKVFRSARSTTTLRRTFLVQPRHRMREVERDTVLAIHCDARWPRSSHRVRVVWADVRHAWLPPRLPMTLARCAALCSVPRIFAL